MFEANAIAACVPVDMPEIVEIVALRPRLRWWEIYRWYRDVYSGSTRPAEFQREVEALRSRGFLHHGQDDRFELTEQGRAVLRR